MHGGENCRRCEGEWWIEFTVVRTAGNDRVSGG